ncbi:hypothetical protein [Rugamonas apoptosis]|uniref:Uncharacterized protein n=1 Tax=Rugamonas apoptosis TaxID=2758570 RepID=A0A7W2FBV6_9BURK|nr:hypothetical protein [Rugamonas apoptosis]MBA5688867.1 hypothetical protein [Rugamonas apoptosis]
METLQDGQLVPCERVRFASLCRRHGLRPERFLVTADPLGFPGGEGGQRTVRVLYLHGCRRYRLDPQGLWLAAFEADLWAGHFHLWRGADCA